MIKYLYLFIIYVKPLEVQNEMFNYRDNYL